MNPKKIFSEVVFWLHLPIVIIWVGLFFVPQSVWPEKISFHFWYVAAIMAMQLVWGLVYFPVIKKIRIICPLTTLMQWLRGIPFKSQENYQHSFVAEILNRYKIKIHHRGVTLALLITLIIIFIQYFMEKF